LFEVPAGHQGSGKPDDKDDDPDPPKADPPAGDPPPDQPEAPDPSANPQAPPPDHQFAQSFTGDGPALAVQHESITPTPTAHGGSDPVDHGGIYGVPSWGPGGHPTGTTNQTDLTTPPTPTPTGPPMSDSEVEAFQHDALALGHHLLRVDAPHEATDGVDFDSGGDGSDSTDDGQ
jgi:hypothetical protein